MFSQADDHGRTAIFKPASFLTAANGGFLMFVADPADEKCTYLYHENFPEVFR